VNIIGSIKKVIWKVYVPVLIKLMPYRYKLLVRKLKRKEKIKVVFLIQLASSWKYDYLFKLLLDSKRFDPVIVICPVVNHEEDVMFTELNMAFDFFSEKDYPVINSWDDQTQNWLDVKTSIKPDIVFFSNPWGQMSKPEYYIFNFLDTLTCYVPYGFKSSHLYEAIFNKPFQNLLWKIFYETSFHLEMAKKYARNKGMNGLVTGYPGMDNLLDNTYQPKDVWKIEDKSVKRIIWAPHHSILGEMDSNVGFSTFLIYSDKMLEIADIFKEEIQISFKPHPLLKAKLYKHSNWGKLRTDEYFDKWSSLPNTQLDEGNYIDLFLTSDAIINDGESFLVEYLFAGKPAMFLVADDNVTNRFNEFGKLAFNHLYHGRNDIEVRTFIEDVIIGGKDTLKEKRDNFFKENVKPPNDKLSSENIFNLLNEVLTKFDIIVNVDSN
jgi:hypothetical protein